MAAPDRTSSRVLAIVLVAALAVVVVVLSALALQRSNAGVDAQSANPVPSFSLGVGAESPTPTPEAAAGAPPERFLTAGAGPVWRATAGVCDGAEPLVERSVDGGATWADVTPRYRELTQVFALEAFAGTEAEMVGSVAACEVQALRTYTQGTYWDSYPDVLATSRYLMPSDATVVTPDGPAAAPCAAPHGLRAADALALVCDGAAWAQLPGADWVALPPTGVAAVAVVGVDVVVAHAGDACAGIALTRFAGGDGNAAEPVGCAEGADASAPTALAASGDSFLVWSGDSLVTVLP